MIRVKLVHNDEIVRSVALVDSGATTTFIPRKFIDTLGSDLVKNDNVVGGIGGRSKYPSTKIEQMLLIKKTDLMYGEFKNLTAYVLDYDTIPYIILGRDTIFKTFAIEFIENQEKIILRRTHMK